MNRHHPYGGSFDAPRRGMSGPGPDRSHPRFSYDRGGSPRGRGRGRGGHGPPNHFGSGSAGNGYGQSASYESSTPESYSQWNGGSQDYYGQNTNYGESYPPYDDGSGSYNDQGYGSYEGALNQIDDFESEFFKFGADGEWDEREVVISNHSSGFSLSRTRCLIARPRC